ncbi:MAG: hypothetical protein PHP41_04750 [Bacilli bacterium]|jgi:hypothetical protein|nr:hypothetical protein [Bacilli bacterium]MDY0063728.1 hypothetical protein [Bacilli bacterium]
MEFLKTFLGYLFVTSGVYALYLMLFRKDRLPPIFSKLFFMILMILISIAMIILGWAIATGEIWK